MEFIAAETLKPLLSSPAEIAFLDIREHGDYGEGHPFCCVSAPLSILEHRAPILLPLKSTPIVLLDDNDGLSEKAAQVLKQEGYCNIKILRDGVAGWTAAGYGLFKGVNVPSKAFGELVEHHMGTPSISAEELKQKYDAGEDMVVLDGRTPAEFRKMSIPGARSCPNADLAYRMAGIVSDASTPVIINCAGRTRSIIGAETLRQAGIKNPIYALRNGTQGWRLAGFDLNHGQDPDKWPAPNGTQQQATSELADAFVRQRGLVTISSETLAQWMQDEERTTYLLDVRSEEEFVKSHLPGARHAPGGQLVQATDEYVAVRGARLVLCDDTQLRAATTAFWLGLMGHDVSVLAADASTGQASGAPIVEVSSSITAHEAMQQQAKGALLLDASRSMSFRSAHIAVAQWVTRARLDRVQLPASDHIIVTARDARLIAGIVTDLRSRGVARIDWFVGSPKTWKAAGFELIHNDVVPGDAECIDYLFFVHDRHDGNLEAARQYLAWEVGLLEQLDAQERAQIDLQARAVVTAPLASSVEH